MAFDSDEKPRPLEYPLYNDQGVEVETPEGETADTPFSWQTEDPDERVTITMELSLNEYVALATAVDVGRDIAFNEDSMKIWWIWIRSVNPMSFCEQLINCIENDEDVRAALNGVIAQYNKDHGAPGNLMPDSDRVEDWGQGFNPECDPDIVWSECVAVVERCNTTIVDLLESISEADTIAKVVGTLAELPLIENLGLSSLTDLATLLIELGLTSYNDAYSTEWAETLECAIFCAAKEDCVIDFIKVWDILRPRVEDEIVGFVPPGNFLDMAGWAAALGTFTAELLGLDKADLLFYLIFGGLAYGNVILNQNNIGAGILKIAVVLASDEPSNDWETLCDDCPDEWSHEFDFEFAEGDGFTIAVGEYSFGIGYVNDIEAGFPFTVDIRLSPTWGASELTDIKIYAYSENADAASFRGVYYPDGGGAAQDVGGEETGEYVIEITANNPTPPTIAFQISNSLVSGNNVIRKIRLSGIGADPFE